jgi:uncharacterized protein YkwD
MKKLIVTTLLTLTLATSTLYSGNVNPFSTNTTAVASAATVQNIKLSKPSISVGSKTSNCNNLNISKVNGADGYKLYRSTSKNGNYEYIGSTKSCNYKDTDVKGSKAYYYKAKAYKNVDGKKVNGKYSNKLCATPTVTSVKSNADIQKIIDSLINKNTTTKPQTTTTTKPTTNTTKPTTTTTKPETGSTQTYDSSYASQVLKLVNVERRKGGLSELTMSQALVAPANKRAKEIVQQFSHTRPNGTQWSTVLDEFNVKVQAAGENLAYGYNTPEAVVDGWMNSPGHRANIMNGNFKKIGVGVYKDSKGTVYATQLFSN